MYAFRALEDDELSSQQFEEDLEMLEAQVTNRRKRLQRQRQERSRFFDFTSDMIIYDLNHASYQSSFLALHWARVHPGSGNYLRE